MPVQIGAHAHNFSDPTGLLSDCHRRIEMFLRALERVAAVVDRPSTDETRAALESALRYFRDDHLLAGSLHAEVEALGQKYLTEGSLESTATEAFRKAIANLASIYKEHISIEDDLVFPLAARWMSTSDKKAIAEEMATSRQ